MRLPKRIDDILKRKDVFLADVRRKFERSTVRLQSSLFEQIIEEIIPRLDVKDGLLLDNANNYRLISELDKVYDTFNTKVAETILPQVNKGIDQIIKLNETFFTLAIADLPARFAQVLEKTKVLTDLRMGLRTGKMIRGGMFHSMLRTEPSQLQQLLAKAVTSQSNMREFIRIIKENIVGTEEKKGLLDRQFQRFAYDTYQQYDRAYNKKLGDEFGMKYFAYQGNLIEDSRDFCAAHYNKVWSIEETKDWATWTPARGQSDGEFPDGYEIKAKDIYVVPSYIGYPGYDPVIDLGGYNCRHIYAPIPDQLAFKYRPELK
jgi:hypothetical protein